MSEKDNDVVVEETVVETAPEAPVEEKVVEAPVVEEKAAPVVEKAPKAAKAAAKPETVAIYSNGNKTWQGVGKIRTGYNIVAKENADQWLTQNGVRIATPEEVAKELGN